MYPPPKEQGTATSFFRAVLEPTSEPFMAFKRDSSRQDGCLLALDLSVSPSSSLLCPIPRLTKHHKFINSRCAGDQQRGEGEKLAPVFLDTTHLSGPAHAHSALSSPCMYHFRSFANTEAKKERRTNARPPPSPPLLEEATGGCYNSFIAKTAARSLPYNCSLSLSNPPPLYYPVLPAMLRRHPSPGPPSPPAAAQLFQGALF